MLPTAADHNKRRHAQQGHAADGEHPRAVAAGFGEVKTGVVDDCQRHDGIALRHADVLTVDGTGGKFGRTYFVTILKLEVPIALADSTYSFSDTESTFA